MILQCLEMVCRPGNSTRNCDGLMGLHMRDPQLKDCSRTVTEVRALQFMVSLLAASCAVMLCRQRLADVWVLVGVPAVDGGKLTLAGSIFVYGCCPNGCARPVAGCCPTSQR